MNDVRNLETSSLYEQWAEQCYTSVKSSTDSMPAKSVSDWDMSALVYSCSWLELCTHLASSGLASGLLGASHRSLGSAWGVEGARRLARAGAERTVLNCEALSDLGSSVPEGCRVRAPARGAIQGCLQQSSWTCARAANQQPRFVWLLQDLAHPTEPPTCPTEATTPA